MNKGLWSAALLFAAFSSQAQMDTLRGGSYDEVVVTANKFAQKQSTTGKVITVITKEQIEKSSGKTVTQLLNEQAGITVNGALNNLGTNTTLYLRGAREGRTLILIDGVPVSDPTFIEGQFDLNLLSLNNIERIEISRGAQSTLYGSDAEAGVVNFITVKNDNSKAVNVKAVASAGSFGTYRGNVQVYGKASKLSYQAGYAKLYSKGFSSAYDSTGKADFEKDKYDGDVANASVQYQFTPELSVRSFARYNRYKTSVDEGAFTDDKDYTNTNDMKMIGGSVMYKKSGVCVTANYQYSENKRSYFDDTTDGFNYFTNDFFGKSQFAEVYTNLELSKNLSLLTGGDYRYGSMNSSFISPFFTALFADTSASQSSTYASLFFHNNDRKLNIELGGRLNVHSKYGSNHTYTFNPSYSINKYFRVFGSVATAYKAPSLFQLFDPVNGSVSLKPEKSRTYEFGVENTGKTFSSRVVFFHRRITDGIDFDNTQPPYGRYFNFAKQRVNGLEIEERVQPIKQLSIIANYTFMAPKELTQDRVTIKDTTFTYLLKRPKHSGNLTVAYSDKGLYVSVTGRYVGKRRDAGGYDPVTYMPLPDVQLGSYILVGAYAEYSFNKYLKVFVDGQNLTNKKFFDIRGYNSIPAMVNGGVVVTL